MTARDDAITALDTALEAARVEGAQSRDAEVATLTTQLADAESAISDYQGEIADYKTQVAALEADIDRLEAEIEGEQPAPKLAMGMNFKPAGQPFENKAEAARIYVDTGRTDIHQEPEFVRAYNAGIRLFVFSWKETTTPRWFGTIPEDVIWYGCHWHEPENDIPGTLSLATWQSRQKTQMTAVRAAGGIPTVILMGYTLSPASKRNPADYTLPAGLVDVYGIDFYPDKSPNRTQAQMIGALKDALKVWGVSRYLLGEYGVIGTAADAVADIKEVKSLIADGEVACYWSSQAAGKPDYGFTQQTADAWFN